MHPRGLPMMGGLSGVSVTHLLPRPHPTTTSTWVRVPVPPDQPVLRHHPAWQPGQALIAAEGGADRRSAKIAAVPMNQSREAHRSPSWGRAEAVGYAI